jgi:tetratricopeptide (TPR) repeat protein
MHDHLLRVALAALLACAALAAGGPAAEKPPWQRLLQGDDARQAQALEKQITALQQAGQFEEALKKAETVAQLRQERQGKDHWEAVNAHFDAETIRRVLQSSTKDQEEYRRALKARSEADTLEQQGQYPRALPLREQVHAARRKVLGEDHPSTAASYHDIAYNLYLQGRFKEAEASHKKALAICLAVLGEEHPDTALTRTHAAANLTSLARYRDAQEELDKALAVRRKVLGEKHLATAEGHTWASANLEAQGRFQEAEQGYRQTLAICRELLGEEHPNTAASYNNLGLNLDAQGRHKEAEELARKALAIVRQVLGEDHLNTAASYNNVALNLDKQGLHKEAEEGYRRGWEICRKVLGEDHLITAAACNNLAGNLQAQGRYREAEEGFKKALAIRQKLVGDEHPLTAAGYHNLASDLEAQGRWKEAEDDYRRALEVRRKVLGEGHPLTARNYNNLASNLYSQDRFAEAEEGHRKALAIFTKALGEEHPDTATCWSNLAEDLQAQGRHQEAAEGLRKALAIRRQLLGEDHPDTAASYAKAAANLQCRGKYQDAEDLYRGAADRFLAARLHIAATGLGRAAKTSERSPLLPLSALLARNGKPAAAWERFEQSLGRGAWDDLSARRRRSAPEELRQAALVTQVERLDRLLERHLAIREPTPSQEQERKDLLERHRKALEDLIRFTHDLEDKYGPAAGKELDREQIQKALPEDTALVGWIDLPAAPRAVDANGEHWAVVLRAQGEPVFEALRGSGPGGAWTREDDTLPQRLRTALAARNASWQALAASLQEQRLRPLTRHLAASGTLPAVHHLVVLPSAALAGVPLESLGDGPTVSYALSGTLYTYLKKQPAVKSAGLLALGDPVFESPAEAIRPRPLPPGGVLLTVVPPGSNAAKARLQPGDVLLSYNGKALGGPADLPPLLEAAREEKAIPVTIWREGEERPLRREIAPGKLGAVVAGEPAPKALGERYRLDRVLAARSGDDGWAQLPGTRVEVESLRRLFGDKPAPRALLDSEASEQRLDELAASGELGKYRYLHLATHGEVDDAWALRSAVILSRDTLPDPEKQLLAGKPAYDGRLTAEEMLRTWSLHSDLVTLSACQTALGKYEKGEGFVGFAQALLLCGSRSVCLSLWKVDDAATALLMQRFYANLLGKRAGLKAPLPKAAALREAKEWLRNLSREEALRVAVVVSQGVERGKGRPKGKLLPPVPEGAKDDRPYAHPYYWAAFVLIGDPG